MYFLNALLFIVYLIKKKLNYNMNLKLYFFEMLYFLFSLIVFIIIYIFKLEALSNIIIICLIYTLFSIIILYKNLLKTK